MTETKVEIVKLAGLTIDGVQGEINKNIQRLSKSVNQCKINDIKLNTLGGKAVALIIYDECKKID